MSRQPLNPDAPLEIDETVTWEEFIGLPPDVGDAVGADLPDDSGDAVDSPGA